MSQFCNAVWVQMLRTAEHRAVEAAGPDAPPEQVADAVAAAHEHVRQQVSDAGPRPVIA